MAMPLDRPYKHIGRAPKLTPEQAAQLRARHATGITRAQLAREFGISHSAVTAYANGRQKKLMDRATA